MSLFKGWFGEKKTAFNIWFSLNKSVYLRFHDIIIPSNNGTTQIDHIVVSKYGIFIIETKNKKGWIFGSSEQPKWTQTIYGKKYVFQNPLRQTYRQKKVLANFLSIDEHLIHTVVFFVGDCKFKTQLPENVINSDLGSYVKGFKDISVLPEEVELASKKLESHLIESSLTTRDHVRSLRKRHESNTVCSKCGAPLTERMSKSGANAGTKFLGCTNYPRCRFTKSL